MRYQKSIKITFLTLVLVFLFPLEAKANDQILDYSNEVNTVEYYQYLANNSKVKTSSYRILLDTKGASNTCGGDVLGSAGDIKYPTATGNFYTEQKTYFICIAPDIKPKYSKILTFFHERGHLYELNETTPQQRSKFRRIMGYRWGWRTNIGYDYPVEEFYADAFAFCAYRPPFEWLRGKKDSEIWSFWPTKRQLKRVCKEVFYVV